VPRLLGGSASKAEEHLRRALACDSQNLAALSFLADVLAFNGRRSEARTLLQRILDVPISTEWAPEEHEFKKRAAEQLKSLTGVS
jgi:cytochrome c-type biogenesis protein CcmH/NrfG